MYGSLDLIDFYLVPYVLCISCLCQTNTENSALQLFVEKCNVPLQAKREKKIVLGKIGSVFSSFVDEKGIQVVVQFSAYISD